MTDEQFFSAHPDRKAHIRKPYLELHINKQRSTSHVDECEEEFRMLGEHKRDRRRILLWRVPADNPHYDPKRQPILKIPFLLFADESVEDTDEILLPIIHHIMLNARNNFDGG
jgi:hypothetical protein